MRTFGPLILAGCLGAQAQAAVWNDPSFPKPPQQSAVWEHEDNEIGKAAEVLFNAGLPDPRGCEYRTVFIGTGENPQNKTGLPASGIHAWVIPHEPGHTAYAFGWDGMIFPVVLESKPASIEDDIRDLLRATPNRWSISLSNDAREQGATPLAVLYLARLGKWDAANEAVKVVRKRFWDDPILPMVSVDWTWQIVRRAISQYTKGNDAWALKDTQLALEVIPQLETGMKLWAADYKPKNPYMPVMFKDVDFLQRLKTECQRRLAPEGNTLVVPGSPRTLINSLVFVDNPQLLSDSRVQALVKCGTAAIPDLIWTIENDARLTRSFTGFTRGSNANVIVPVSLAANVALNAIFGTSFEIGAGENRHQYAERLKNYLARQKAEADYRTLQDDKAGIPAWVEAGQNIVLRLEEIGNTGLQFQGGQLKFMTNPAGEPLRAHSKPTVTELLVLRSDQAAETKEGKEQDLMNLKSAAWLAIIASRWEPKACGPVLLRRLNRLIAVSTQLDPKSPDYIGDYSRLYISNLDFDNKRWAEAIKQDTLSRVGDQIPGLVVALSKTDTETGWPLFARWIRETKSQPMSGNGDYRGLMTALEAGADQPEITPVLNWFFHDPQGPAYDFPARKSPVRPSEFEYGGLATTPAFLRQAQRKLEDTTAVGWVETSPFTNWNRPELHRTTGQSKPFWRRWMGGKQTAREGSVEFRTCDYFAWLLGEKCEGAPQCELDWPLEKRDLAVADSRRWVGEVLKTNRKVTLRKKKEETNLRFYLREAYESADLN